MKKFCKSRQTVPHYLAGRQEVTDIDFQGSKKMFALPSVWNLVVSTVVCLIVAWYARRYLEEQDIPEGMTRSLLVFAVASLASWGAGNAIDWVVGTPADVQPSAELNQLLKAAGQQSQ